MLAVNFFREVFGGYKHYEQYEYKVIEEFETWEIRKFETWEIRKYPPRVGVSTSCPRRDDMKRPDDMFMKLARYIGVFSSPENTKVDSIAMTTPVVTSKETTQQVAMTTPVVVSSNGADEKNDASNEVMKFILPSKYQTPEEAPVPNDPDVKIFAVPSKLVAASTFSGSHHGDSNKMKEEYLKLKEKFLEKGYVETGPYEGHYFNPPYALPFLRRNDICVPVRLEKQESKKRVSDF